MKYRRDSRWHRDNPGVSLAQAIETEVDYSTNDPYEDAEYTAFRRVEKLREAYVALAAFLVESETDDTKRQKLLQIVLPDWEEVDE